MVSKLKNFKKCILYFNRTRFNIWLDYKNPIYEAEQSHNGDENLEIGSRKS